MRVSGTYRSATISSSSRTRSMVCSSCSEKLSFLVALAYLVSSNVTSCWEWYLRGGECRGHRLALSHGAEMHDQRNCGDEPASLTYNCMLKPEAAVAAEVTVGAGFKARVVVQVEDVPSSFSGASDIAGKSMMMMMIKFGGSREGEFCFSIEVASCRTNTESMT